MHEFEMFIAENAQELFHLPYALTQDAIGETDGGIADIFEIVSGEFASGFANAGGHLVISKLYEHYSPSEILDRISAIEPPKNTQRFDKAELMTEASITEISEETSQLWHSALKTAFPDISADIDIALASTSRAITKLLQYQYLYSDEREAKLSSPNHP